MLKINSLLYYEQKTAYEFSACLVGSEICIKDRQSHSRDKCIFCVNNLTPEPQRFALADLNLMRNEQWYDLISDQAMPDVWSELELSPYQCLWITNRPRDH